MTNIRNIGRMITLAAACAAAGTALAQAPGPGYGPGPGMMVGGPGHGHAHGPGMHPGMMPHHGGPGPAGSPGLMRGRWERMGQMLGLSEDQRAKIRGIFEETRRKNWDAIGQIQSERFRLRELMRGDQVDPNAAVEQKRKIDDLKRQVMRARLEARNQVLALLTPEQREKAKTLRQNRGMHGRG